MNAIATAQPDRASQRRRPTRVRARRTLSPVAHRHGGPTTARLGGYRDARGRPRELVALRGRRGSVLVIDRDAGTLRDRLLLAHLAADEPAGNAMLVCRDYLGNPSRPRPRRLLAGDLLASPTRADVAAASGLVGELGTFRARGCDYRLRPVPCAGARPELRWTRYEAANPDSLEPVGLRELVGVLESYEPVRTITAEAIRSGRHDRKLSLRQLQGEYRWLSTSPVVLNRALREAVVRATADGDPTMSELALRCGIVKRDRRGGAGGESSWLARRVGLMPEGGCTRVTPWIHSEVLALIAREGLRVSPREVEVP